MRPVHASAPSSELKQPLSAWDDEGSDHVQGFGSRFVRPSKGHINCKTKGRFRSQFYCSSSSGSMKKGWFDVGEIHTRKAEDLKLACKIMLSHFLYNICPLDPYSLLSIAHSSFLKCFFFFLCAV